MSEIASAQAYSSHAVPECHADGAQPEGYSPTEETCPHCSDKFTCLVRSVEKGLSPSVELDSEVLEVQHGKVPLADALRRLEERRRALRSQPPSELPKIITAQQPANTMLPSSAFDAAPEQTQKTKQRIWDSRPREITEQEMQLQLAPTQFKERGVRIGQTFTLAVGMQLVRRKRKTEVVVTLRSTGFELAGRIYPTLSAAAIASEHRSVSGNDFFALVHPSVEVRAADGAVLAKGGKVELEQQASAC